MPLCCVKKCLIDLGSDHGHCGLHRPARTAELWVVRVLVELELLLRRLREALMRSITVPRGTAMDVLFCAQRILLEGLPIPTRVS